MAFRPLHDRVLVRRIEADSKTAGGIIIPDSAQEKPSEGEIVAVGDGARDDDGDRIALDVGSSTGGFTDCLLQRGAAKVYAVDVGTNQLAWKLRTDPRVVSMEKTNIREVTRAQIPDPIDLIVCDASFVGLRLVLPAALALAAPGAHLAALIKPQFEVGKGRVGKGGIVRDPELHAEVVDTISSWLALQPGWQVLGVTESPITGAEGNKEFLIAAQLS